MTWALPIWIYLWLAGMAGGAYFSSFLADRFGGGGNKQLFRLAVYLGIPLIAAGVLLLIFDLGHPLLFWHLLVRFKVASPMSIGTWILTAWVVFAALLAVIWWVENHYKLTESVSRILKRITGIVSGIGLLLSVATMSYTGVLLAVSSRPLWASTPLIPSLFTLSAIATGTALLVIASLTVSAINRGGFLKSLIKNLFGSTDWIISNEVIERLAGAGAIVTLIEIVVLIGYAIWLGNSVMAGTGEGLALLTTGPLNIMFWVGVVFLALLFPLALDLFNWGKNIGKRPVMYAGILACMCVLLGGFILRLVITLGGQL